MTEEKPSAPATGLPAEPETQPVDPGPVPVGAAPETLPAANEPEVQSKFGAPASNLGIRPPTEQSKTPGSSPATSLRPSAIPVRPPEPGPPAAPTPALSPPPVGVAPVRVVPPAAPAPRVAPVAPAVPIAPARPAALPADQPIDEEPELTFGDRLRRLSPALVTLSAGSIASLIFLVIAMTSHTTPVAVLLSAGVVVGLIFATDAVIASVATWRAAVRDEEPGRALLLAIVAGGSAVICAAALGATTVLVLVLSGF